MIKYKIKNKRGALGEGLLMIYRLVLIAFIALIVLGLSAVYYDYYLDVRDAEATIMARESVNCLAPDGVIDVSLFENNKKSFLERCDYGADELQRFYVNAEVFVAGQKIIQFEQGDSGSKWIYDLFKNQEGATGKIAKYKPGYFPKTDYESGWIVGILENGEVKEAELKLEVFVNHEL